ncbi:MAG: hypothetical protein ACOVNU_03995 [Candidatus Kapaibacteriota bacterium]
MSNNKQSSVRWVIEELQKFTRGESKFFSKTAIINHVDRMHEKEIKTAFYAGMNCSAFYFDPTSNNTEAEQYYNETFE